MYRIAVHEASNRKRWWFRHKAREVSIEPEESAEGGSGLALANKLVDRGESPLENIAQQQLKARVESELRQLDEPFRTAIILREIEELSYEEIAEVMQTSLGTVKSRITRGREALKKRLFPYLRELGPEMARSDFRPQAGQKVEVTS